MKRSVATRLAKEVRQSTDGELEAKVEKLPSGYIIVVRPNRKVRMSDVFYSQEFYLIYNLCNNSELRPMITRDYKGVFILISSYE